MVVSRRNTPQRAENPTGGQEQAITRHHEVNSRTIIELVQGSLNHIRTDPVPQRIIIDSISIYRQTNGRLGIDALLVGGE
jgi:hypothetical protein